jgi:dTDP-glucose 4,6-dehydratase
VKEELGWKPEHSLDEGLKATVDWYLSHSDWVDAVMDASYRDYYETQYSQR